MKQKKEHESVFIKEIIEDFIYIWQHSSIDLIDIRHKLINSEEPLENYRMPTSMFFYTSSGRAEIILDGISYTVERFGIFHGGKGIELSIYPKSDWLEYYMVLYKAGEPFTGRKKYSQLLEYNNPFQQQYGFVPENPIFLSELFRKMYEKWREPTSLNLFYGKTAFYQLIYEVYEQMDKGHIAALQPDIVAMVRRFIAQSYAENINIQDMANVFGISYSHLHRLFSRKMGTSPQKYLVKTRLNACKEWLEQSELSMREIAHETGFSDEHHFNRMFVRHTGMTPGEYRKKMTTNRRDYALGNLIPFPYNEESQVSLDELEGKGVTSMLKQMKSKAVVAAALSLMLLFSACSAAPANTSGADAIQTTSQVTKAEKIGKETRIISTSMGDVEVPANPQKIAVWVYEQELYSLGVTPVSVSPGNYDTMWPDVPVFSYAPDKEELMSLEPDLLITYDDAVFYEEYSKIAPVVCIPLDTSAEDALRLIGNLLNMSEKAEELINDFNQQAETIKTSVEKRGALGKTAVLVEPLADSIWVYDNAYGRGGAILYDYLGFVMPDVVKNELGKEHFMKVSLELLPQYCDADYIVVVTGEGYDALKEKTIWQTIAAEKNNNVIEYDAASFDGRGLDAKTLSFFEDYFTAD